jgi:hypothetical protein
VVRALAPDRRTARSADARASAPSRSRDIAARLGVTPRQLAPAFLTRKGFTIPKTSNVAHVDELAREVELDAATITTDRRAVPARTGADWHRYESARIRSRVARRHRFTPGWSQVHRDGEAQAVGARRPQQRTDHAIFAEVGAAFVRRQRTRDHHRGLDPECAAVAERTKV